MRHIDLFSGIGGFALAADRVFGDVEHIFCDNDPFCQEVLKKHWPNSKIYGDIRTLTNTKSEGGELGRPTEGDSSRSEEGIPRREDCDLLTGGFPCQPFSQAGRRRGTEDDRYLWPEMLRVIREFKPTWVIGENVGGFVTWNEGLVLEQVHIDLEAEGYEVQSFIIPVVAKNAPHRRDRVWIVAHSSSSEHRGGRGQTGETESISSIGGETRYIRGTSGTNSAWEYAEDPIIKRTRRRVEDIRQVLGRKSTEVKNARPGWETHWLEVATRLCRVDDGVPRRLDRNPRLKALGNAIVPQVAEEIMRAIYDTTRT